MILLASLVLASSPAFDPAREHRWGETPQESLEIESLRTDSEVEPGMLLIHDETPPYLRYELTGNSPFEFIALGFNEARLERIVYPVHLPVAEEDVDKPATDVPEKFLAVREWLTAYLGEPDTFSTTETDRDVTFEDAEILLERGAYVFNYTWCAEAANAYLIAQRELGQAPLLVASVESPDRGPDPKDIEAGHACLDNTN